MVLLTPRGDARGQGLKEYTNINWTRSAECCLFSGPWASAFWLCSFHKLQQRGLWHQTFLITVLKMSSNSSLSVNQDSCTGILNTIQWLSSPRGAEGISEKKKEKKKRKSKECCTFVSFVKFKRFSRAKSLSQYEVLPKGRITDNPFELKLYISPTTAIKVKLWEPVKTCLKGKLSLGATEGSFKVDITRSIRSFSKHCLVDVGSLLMPSVTLSWVELSEMSPSLLAVL